MLPTFLGIGAPKAGTTWLHELLGTHPDVAMPSKKEVRFFSKYYARGPDWYASFFPEGGRASGGYRAVGEITPEYLHAGAETVRRVAEMPSVQRLVLIVRHPIERAFSAYAHCVRTKNFEAFAEAVPHEISCGDYGRHVGAYLRHFERDQLLVLVFERLFADVEQTKRTLAHFLSIDAGRFPPASGHAVVNPTYVPRFREAFALAQKALRALHGSRLLGVLRRIGLVEAGRRLLGERDKEEALPPMRAATRRRLARRYVPEVERLEALTGLDLSQWKRTLP